jgi:hypothetical protein
MKTYKGIIAKLAPNDIFVCGTNTQGRSGRGAALWAVHNAGLRYGHIRGICGQTYAIVTKDLTKLSHPSVPREMIVSQIVELYAYAARMLDKNFIIAYSGKGFNLNGYTPKEMASMFVEAAFQFPIPSNIIFEEDFAKLFTEAHVQY